MSRRAASTGVGGNGLVCGALPGLHALSLKTEDIEGRANSEQRAQYDKEQRYQDRLNGPRRKDPDAFQNFDTPRNGSCLFHAMAALLATPTYEGEVPNNVRGGTYEGVDGLGVRILISLHIRENADYFGQPNVIDDSWMFQFDPRSFTETDEHYANRYADYIEKPGTFGGMNEIAAASDIFNCNIVVLQLDAGGTGVIRHLQTDTPTRRNADGSFFVNDDGSYDPMPFEEVMRLDTIVLLMIQEHDLIEDRAVPHYQAIYFRDPDKRRLFMTQSQPGDIVTKAMREAKDDRGGLSVKLEKELAEAVADRMCNKQNYRDLLQLLPPALVTKLVQGAKELIRLREQSSSGGGSGGSGGSGGAGSSSDAM
jgi:hypothetical protein